MKKDQRYKKGGEIDPKLLSTIATVGLNAVGTAAKDKEKRDAKQATENKKNMDTQLKKSEKIIQDFEKTTSKIESKLDSENKILNDQVNKNKQEQDLQLKKKLQIEEANKLKKNKNKKETEDTFENNNSFRVVGQQLMTNISDINPSETLYNSNPNNDPEFTNNILYKIQYKLTKMTEFLNKISESQSNISELFSKQKNITFVLKNFSEQINNKLLSYKDTKEDKLKKLYFLNNLKIELNKILSNIN